MVEAHQLAGLEGQARVRPAGVIAELNFVHAGGKGLDNRTDLAAKQSVVAVPASAISYAPYGDSVFIVTDLKDPKGKTYRGVRQQFVKLAGARGDQVAVVSGLRPGDEVVSSGVFKLRNGAAVQVNNKVQPGNSRTPTPEDS